ncbi:hypothetical protein BASA50_009859 [Batrachochytrium salamandrivorans]|uniref:VWFD domain-containing protein n=1 Tax=Batrachochytrium salamandrivorans TaxID=1357716 RepID=A0ABQ8F3D8_9FUNG|nr:hypothetical protein BASA50_009859 [Batrachochytrium salamandrivorans]
MLSRLIVTFLCAATIGSVSGAFMTFDPAPIEFEDIEILISFSAKLNSKPTEEVTVYLEHPSMSMSKCMIVFNPDNWNVPQEITAIPAPLFVGSSNPPGPLEFNSKLLARAETVGQLPAELSTIDTLEVTRRRDAPFRSCSLKKNQVNTFDSLKFSFNEPGWYYMMFTEDIEIQVFMDECGARLLCIKKVVARYGSSAMSLDVSGPVKNLREYSVTEVTQNTNGLRYIPRPNVNDHIIHFPYESILEIHMFINGGVVGLEVYVSLGTGYILPDGLCNIPRPRSQDNELIGPNGESYNPDDRADAAAFANSWSVKDEDVLTNPGARTLNLPIRPGTVCTFPEKPPPKPTTTTTLLLDFTTTTTTTISFSTYVSSFTVDLSKSTLSPTITYALSSTTITTSPSTTSTTLPYLPDPPAPGGYVPPRLDSPLDIRLHGQLVSRVESYKYLGVLIDSKLDHSAWLKQKRSALEHTISALHPVLANHQLTVNYRSRIFSVVIMGKAYYGLELVGGNKPYLAPLKTTINKGIRLFTGARLSTAIGPLLVETGIGFLLTRSLVSRVRLLERSVTKRTPINAICSGTDNDVFTLNVQGQLVRSQRWFWSRRTKQLYRNRYWLTPQVRPKTVKQRHSFALMETLRTCGDSASLQKYVTRQLLDTFGFFKDPSFDQSRAHGTRYLMLARMDALWTARKAIQIGILVDTHPFSVDHCILCNQQLLSTSIAHLVVECEQVTGHRIQSGLVPAIQKSRLRLLGRALDPGVENVYTWLRGGVLNGEADLDQRWLDGTVEHESMGTRHDNRALAAQLADFLQVAYRQYQSTLWKYHRDRLVEGVLN